MEGLTFVITGVLESIEREEAKSLIERYGGKVTGNISKKTNYLVMGRDCGAAKCDKVSYSQYDGTICTTVIELNALIIVCSSSDSCSISNLANPTSMQDIKVIWDFMPAFNVSACLEM